MDTKELVARLRRASRLVYLATEDLVANDISAKLTSAADTIERLERERDEANANARMYEATAAEAARGLECLSDIDDAWDAIGTRGNRKALTLAEQISSLDRELDAAESELATLRARVVRLEDSDRDWGRLHQQVIEERAAALLRIERLEEALRRELNILEVEVQPIVKPSKKEWVARRAEYLRDALKETTP